MIPEPSGKLAMLANGGDPDSIPGALMEVKYDGHRMFAYVLADGVHMYARTGVEKTGKLPAIEREIARDYPVGTILDGEVISANANGGDWSKVQTVLGADSKVSNSLTFMVFDILAVMGEDVRLYPLSSRRMFLEEIEQRREPEHVHLAEQVAYNAEAVEALIRTGHEGAIIKDPNGTYRSGKRDWIKVKATYTEDVVVMGATEGKGKFAGQVGALVFGQYDTASSASRQHYIDTGEYILVEAGQASGMTDAQRESFTRRVDGRYAGTNLVGEVIEIQHMGKMPSGGWRHPQFKRLRTDKLAEECVA